MGAMVSQIPSLTIFYSTVYSGADQRKHQLAFVRGIHRWSVNSLLKSWPVTRKMFPYDDVTMNAEEFADPALFQFLRDTVNPYQNLHNYQMFAHILIKLGL